MLIMGFKAMGNFEHYDHVRAVVPVWLVPRYGLASLWTYHGSLVVQKSVAVSSLFWNCAHNVGGGLPPLLFLLGMAVV